MYNYFTTVYDLRRYCLCSLSVVMVIMQVSRDITWSMTNDALRTFVQRNSGKEIDGNQGTYQLNFLYHVTAQSEEMRLTHYFPYWNRKPFKGLHSLFDTSLLVFALKTLVITRPTHCSVCMNKNSQLVSGLVGDCCV